MKTLTNVNVASFSEAAAAAQSARQQGKLPAFSGGGTDLLQQIKDGTDAVSYTHLTLPTKA